MSPLYQPKDNLGWYGELVTAQGTGPQTSGPLVGHLLTPSAPSSGVPHFTKAVTTALQSGLLGRARDTWGSLNCR